MNRIDRRIARMIESGKTDDQIIARLKESTMTDQEAMEKIVDQFCDSVCTGLLPDVPVEEAAETLAWNLEVEGVDYDGEPLGEFYTNNPQIDWGSESSYNDSFEDFTEDLVGDSWSLR